MASSLNQFGEPCSCHALTSRGKTRPCLACSNFRIGLVHTKPLDHPASSVSLWFHEDVGVLFEGTFCIPNLGTGENMLQSLLHWCTLKYECEIQ